MSEKEKAGFSLTTEDGLEIEFRKGDANWHDGPGWYFWEAEYPDEGSCGAFATPAEAKAWARKSYTLTSGSMQSP